MAKRGSQQQRKRKHERQAKERERIARLAARAKQKRQAAKAKAKQKRQAAEATTTKVSSSKTSSTSIMSRSTAATVCVVGAAALYFLSKCYLAESADNEITDQVLVELAKDRTAVPVEYSDGGKLECALSWLQERVVHLVNCELKAGGSALFLVASGFVEDLTGKVSPTVQLLAEQAESVCSYLGLIEGLNLKLPQTDAYLNYFAKQASDTKATAPSIKEAAHAEEQACSAVDADAYTEEESACLAGPSF
jgi:hypothetical protein